MKRYNIRGDEIEIVECKTCGHQVDISNIKNIKINGIDEIETTALVMVDSLMIEAMRPCCEKPYYWYVD